MLIRHERQVSRRPHPGRDPRGAARAGEQLTEDQLAQIAGVSRTPVREAVRRLEDELLLVRSDTKRLFVADWSRDDIEEMFALRQMLECHAAERAAQRINRAQIAALEAIRRRRADRKGRVAAVAFGAA